MNKNIDINYKNLNISQIYLNLDDFINEQKKITKNLNNEKNKNKNFISPKSKIFLLSKIFSKLVRDKKLQINQKFQMKDFMFYSQFFFL